MEGSRVPRDESGNPQNDNGSGNPPKNLAARSIPSVSSCPSLSLLVRPFPVLLGSPSLSPLIPLHAVPHSVRTVVTREPRERSK